jgi:hypothetical protein
MAAPDNASLDNMGEKLGPEYLSGISLTNMNLEGRWIFHKKLSDSTDALLILQGQPWWKRQVIQSNLKAFPMLTIAQAAAVVTVTEYMKASTPSSGVLRYDIDLRISGGFKGGAEWGKIYVISVPRSIHTLITLILMCP